MTMTIKERIAATVDRMLMARLPDYEAIDVLRDALDHIKDLEADLQDALMDELNHLDEALWEDF